MELLHEDLTYEIIGAAMEVHATLGAGLLESVYQEAFAIELLARGIPFETEKRLDIFYKGIKLEKHFSADLTCYNNVMCYVISPKFPFGKPTFPKFTRQFFVTLEYEYYQKPTS